MINVGRRAGLGLLAFLFGLAPSAALPAPASFSAWLLELRREALQAGIAPRTLDAALADVAPLPEVIAADRRQPETRLTFAAYRARVVNPTRIAQGRELLWRHRDLLAGIERRYRVPAALMVALWGIESSFGTRQGSYPVIAALATLAYDGRRAALFRRELLSALEILDRGDIEAGEMYGSWAGAMGQNQFMPSTYLRHAVDFDGDGRRDIWRSLPDMFASTANYLARAGWDDRQDWGREVALPPTLDDTPSGLDHRAPLAMWGRLGVRLPDGGALPALPTPASLLRMDGGEGSSFLVSGNFRVLMAWNRSTYFGLAAGLLADSLGDG
jgi:membrane-bound lytic murein transglycosylase B